MSDATEVPTASGLASRLQALTSTLFPEPPAGLVSARRSLLLGLAILLGAVISLARTRGPGAINTVWIEDAIVFLNDALTDSPRNNLFEPLNGYFHLGPRVLAEVAAIFPIRWSAPLLSLFAALATAMFGAVAYVASGPFLQRWWLRLLVSAPVVLLPLGRTQADSDVATLQFPGLYALLWIMLWRPATRAGRIAAVGITAFVAFSSILPLILLPLVLLRLYSVRDWTTRLIASVYAAGLSLHIFGLASGLTTRSQVCCRRYEPPWVVREYVTTAVPRTMLGEKWLGGPGIDPAGQVQPLTIQPDQRAALIVIAWLIVLAIIAFAVLRFTSPHWPLAVVAGGFSVAFFTMGVTDSGSVQPRHLIVPALLILTVLAALVRPHSEPRPAGSARPAIALLILVAVVATANYRISNGRTKSQPWSQVVQNAVVACRNLPPGPESAYVQYGPEWWWITIPCRRVR